MSSVPQDVLVDIYRRMARIKHADERIRAVLASGKFAFMYYPPRGQEVIPAAISNHLTSEDYLVTNYRGIHDTLAKGTSYRDLVAEYLGRETGTCKGKGGPMHITDVANGVMVTTGVVGSGLPIAVGLALSSAVKKDNRVTVVNFGDGATNIGAFHEALNMAALWSLPVVFVCQNNEYGEHTKRGDHQLIEQISDRAASYGMPGVTVDGNDPESMWTASGDAIDRARSGRGPTLLEAMTYRFEGHFFGDSSGAYMPELEERRAKDPWHRFEAALLERGHLTESEVEQISKDNQTEFEEALDFAVNSDFPDVAELRRDVYAEEVLS